MWRLRTQGFGWRTAWILSHVRTRAAASKPRVLEEWQSLRIPSTLPKAPVDWLQLIKAHLLQDVRENKYCALGAPWQ
ncbi:hypothetical protein J3F83DRAFT_730718 [Trichoderma novae-zelandiae]